VIFNWYDPLRLDLQLTDVEKEVQQKAFNYAQASLLPRVVNLRREAPDLLGP
jgi:hypothetical protein